MQAAESPLLRRLSTLADLDAADQARVAELCKNRRVVQSKQHITREGDRPEYVHVMLSGWGARYKTLRNGARQIVDFVLPGDFCDLHVALLKKMDHGIITLTQCTVARVGQDEIDELTSENNRVVRAMWWSTLVDQGILREWVLNVGRRDAYERVGHLLCELHFRMTRAGLVKDDQLVLPVTQEELADATGLTPVHINRTLKRLRGGDLLEISRGKLTLLDVPALHKAVGFDPAYLHVSRRIC